MGQAHGGLAQYRAHPGQTGGGERQAEQAAGQADHSGFHQALREHRAPVGAQGAAHAGLGGAAHELGQHQPDRVDQADEQEAE